MKRSEIFIVLGLIAFGLIYQVLDSGREAVGMAASRNLHRLLAGPVERITLDPVTASGFKRLVIINPAGDMSFRNNETGTLEAVPAVECYRVSRKDAERMARRIRLQPVLDGRGTLTLRPDIPRQYNYRHLRVRLDIRLPRDVPVEIQSRYGILEMENLKNPVDCHLSRGDLDVRGHQAALSIHHSHGTINLDNLRNSLDVDTAFSQLRALNCRSMAIRGYHTRMQLQHVRGDVFISNRHEHTELEDFSGNLNLQATDAPVHLKNITAVTMALRSTYETIRGRNITAATADVMVSHCSLDLQFAQITDTLSIKGRHARLRIVLPVGISPLVQLQLKYGKITNRSALMLAVDKSRIYERASLEGDAPVVVVDGQYSDLVLSQTGPSN